MTRLDIHRPSAIVPSDYEFVAFEHMKIESFGDCAAVLANRELIKAHMSRTGGNYSNHAHGGNCMVCGSVNAIYTILFYHSQTNTYVRMGSDCAEKTEMSFGDFNAFHQAVRHHAGIAKGKRAAKAKWEEKGLAEAYALATEYRDAKAPETPKDEHGDDCGSTHSWERPESKCDRCINYRSAVREFQDKYVHAQKLESMLHTTESYGTLSPRMIEAIERLVDRHRGIPEIKAKREEERAQAADCPSGRVTIEGLVVSTKVVESEFGEVAKMTVKANEGFLVYVSVPSGVIVERNDKVKFVATVTVSDRDSKFGFGKRPAKVKGSDSIITELSPR